MDGPQNILSIDRGENTTCTIDLDHIVVTSWKVNGHEQLYMDREAPLVENMWIKGGISLLFLQFGPFRLGPRHGIDKFIEWSLESDPEVAENGDVVVTLVTGDNDMTRCMWNCPFKIAYKITLKESQLNLNLKVHNLSDKVAFTFKLIFPEHFRVHNAEKCEIFGMKGSDFYDRLHAVKRMFSEFRGNLKVNKRVSKIFVDTLIEHKIVEEHDTRQLRIIKEKLPDTVLWNPWNEDYTKPIEVKDIPVEEPDEGNEEGNEKEKKDEDEEPKLDEGKQDAEIFEDRGDKDDRKMISIQPGILFDPPILEPEESYEMYQIIQVFNRS